MSVCLVLRYTNSELVLKPSISTVLQPLLMRSLSILVAITLLVNCRAEADPKLETLLPNSKSDENIIVPHRTNWRDVLRSEYSSQPITSVIRASSPEYTPQESNSEVVVLEPLVITERRFKSNFRELDKIIRDDESTARTEAKLRKIGIASNTFKLKHSVLNCSTIFFIPVSFGISF